ncbi:MAG: hypothetical protein IJ666_06080 [Ruminococcus sp.]|nr:hypothetical protein [Ruminococcus sp.]
MDNVMIIFALILFIIAVFEIFTLFFGMPLSTAPPYVTLLPVFGTDALFAERLERLSVKSGGRSRIVIVFYSPDNMQKAICEQFCANNPDTVIVSPENLEKILYETFAIDEKM